MVFCQLSRVEQAQRRHMITQKHFLLQLYFLLDGGLVLLFTQIFGQLGVYEAGPSLFSPRLEIVYPKPNYCIS